jgi:hypothetical protein
VFAQRQRLRLGSHRPAAAAADRGGAALRRLEEWHPVVKPISSGPARGSCRLLPRLPARLPGGVPESTFGHWINLNCYEGRPPIS